MDPNYDFIMNPQKTGGGSSMGAKSQKQRIMTVVFVGGILLVIVVLAFSLLSRIGSQGNEQVVDLVAYQSELKRVIALGKDRSRSSTTKNKVITASFTLESDYQRSVQLLRDRGISPPKDIAVRYSGGNSDELLDAAEKNNNFDSVYEELYVEKLTNYKNKLAEIYPSLSAGEQAVLKSQNNNAKLLLGEPLEVPAG